MNKILILGSHSFVSKGLVSELDSLSYYVHEFSRGKKRRQDNKIYGNYLSISSNELFDNSYDIVINFAILKDQSLDDNIQFIKDLIDFCKSHGVKKLIHFSSIMVYNYALKDVTENTEIEHLDYTTLIPQHN